MVVSQSTFQRIYPAVREILPQARAEVVEYARAAGLRGERLEGVRLAVSEAVSNVILHAYPEGEGAVHVSVAVVDDEVSVLVVDDGCGYRTPARTPGLGCGLDLMADAADDLVLAERAQGGTEAQMRFCLAASAVHQSLA